MNKQITFILLYCSFTLLLTACWDETNIEERGFVTGLSIDLVDEKESDYPQVTVTNQFVVPSGVGSPSDSAGGGNQQAFQNISGSGDSIFAIDKEMRALTNIIPFFEHLKVIVVSEDVLSTPNLFPSIMDVFFRNHEIRRVTKVMIAEGKAKEILDIMPEHEKVPSLYMDTLLDINLQNIGILRPVELGDIHELLLNDSTFTLPKYIPGEKKLNYKGGTVYHGHEGKLVGTLSQEEIQGLNFVIGEYQGGPIEFDHKGNLITLNIDKGNSKFMVDAKDKENIKVSVNINTEGSIEEVFGAEEITNIKNIVEIEKNAKEKIEEIVQKTIDKAQNELNADVFGLNNKLRQRHYQTWQEVKNDWDHGDNYFKKSTFDVTVKIKVRSAGDSEKSNNHVKE